MRPITLLNTTGHRRIDDILRDLCRKTLAFENHYLALYRDYLLELLRGDEPARRLFAAGRLKDVVYPDQEAFA